MDAPIALILDTLSKMVKESEELIKCNDIIQFFCLRVIPFILEHPLLDAVRRKWHERRDLLQSEVTEAENEAVNAYMEAFYEIKEALKNDPTPMDQPIEEKILLIEHIIDKRVGSFPFSRGLYDEILDLLGILLEAGHIDVCRLFCEIGTTTMEVINPSKERRWFVRMNEKWDYKQIQSPEAEKVDHENVFSLPGVDTIYKYEIDSCRLAPFNYRVFSTNEATSPHKLQDPAIVWWYFESALWCWNTPSSHFDEKLKAQGAGLPESNFYLKCEKETWWEIVSAKESRSYCGLKLFEGKLFKQGIKTLVGDITAYFSRFATEETILKSIKDEITFELIFDKHEKAKNGSLWISVTSCEGPSKKYHIKKFNNDSLPWRFAQLLLDENPQGGIITVNIDDSNNVSKLIERLGLGAEMRKLFFGSSGKNNVSFKGKSVTKKRQHIENLNFILNELLEKHNQAGAPQFKK